MRTFQFELGSLPFEQAMAEGRRAAQRALELDPTLAAAHLSMARIHYFEWEWGPAEAEIQRARQLDPADADVLRWAGILAMSLGHTDEGPGLLEQAVERDPLNAANYTILGAVNFAVGRYALAQRAYRKAVELAPPRGFGSRGMLPVVLLAMGRLAEALAEFEKLDDEEDREFGKALAYFALGRKADSDAALAVLEAHYAATSTWAIAGIHAYRGDFDDAFAWMDRCYRKRCKGLAEIRIDWLLTKLRGDPRYDAMVRNMKFPE